MIRPKPEWEYSVKIKKILVNLLAVVLAVAILDAFCWWFYNPVAYVHDDVRATDTVRVPNTFNSRAKEGFAWHMTDANGYNNADVRKKIIFENGRKPALLVTEGQDKSELENTAAIRRKTPAAGKREE